MMLTMRKAAILVLLTSVILLSTACTSTITIPKDYLGDISCLLSFTTTATQSFEDKKFDFEGSIETGFDCYPVIKDLYDQLTQATVTPSVPQVFTERLGDSADATPPNPQYLSLPFTTSPLINCSSAPETGTYYYNVPLMMAVADQNQTATQGDLKVFVEPIVPIPSDPSFDRIPPSDLSTDPAQIAQYLYDHDNIRQYLNTPATNQGYSDEFPLTIPAQTVMTLHIPLTLYYRFGIGVVSRSGQLGSGYVWAYAYQFDRPTPDTIIANADKQPVSPQDCA